MILRAFAVLLLLAAPALAQTGAPSDCSGTVGTTSTAISFPSSGNHGPPGPTSYLLITNPNAVGGAKLAVNPTGAAVIDGSGSLPMDTNGAGWLWSAAQGTFPPSSLNIIASTSSTAYSCKYQ